VEIRENTIKAAIFAHTMLAPLGVSNIYENIMPERKQITDTAAEQIVTVMNRLHRRMDVMAGNMIRLDMSIAPIIRIPITTVTAVSTARAVL